ncbi:MAG: hypothetical protein ACSLE9_06710, partial [Burkholderiaceae bacterium]
MSEAAQHERLEQERARRLAEHLARLEERRQPLLREQQQLAAESTADEAGLAEQLARAGAQASAAEQALAAVEVDISTHRGQLDATAAELARLQATIREQRGRLASLETLQQAALAGSGGADAWLSAQGMEVQALLDDLDAAAGWRPALEAALGPWLSAQVVASLDELSAAGLAQAAGLLLLESRPGRADAAGDLLDAVRSTVDLRSLIGAVRRADTLAGALAARHGLAAHESLITADGTRVGPNWLAVPARDHGEGVLERSVEIASLRAAVLQAEQELAAVQAQRAATQAALAEAERARGEARQQHAAGVRQLGDLQARHAAAQAHRERAQARRVAIADELAQIDAQAAHDAAELASARSARDEVARRQAGLAGEREQGEARRRQAESAVRAAREAQDAARERLQTLRMRVQVAQTEVATLQKTLLGWQAQRDGVGERQAASQQEQRAAAAPLEALQRELQTHLSERETAAARLSAARDAVGAAETALREHDQARLLAERALHERRGEVESGRLGLTELETRAAGLREQALEFDADPGRLLAELPPDTHEAALELAIADLSRRIERLGAINLAAIDEQRELAERKAYLDAQHADLAAALETMEQAIRRMDRETRSRFKDTFDKANGGFQAAFPRLFGGGEARLELLDDDLLESGVGIVARPPGKRNSSIHLLSGGEKALTAIALVFALFELNPAPFCMLDEVDAPLDDHNVGRFCALVREMSARVQFIVITHNKTTMELAGQLTGVTMSEP